MKQDIKSTQYSKWKRCAKASLLLIPIFSIFTLGHIHTNTVDANSNNCSYKGVSPTKYTEVNHEQKCLSLEGSSGSIYTLIYKFKVTGISNAANK